MDELTEDVGEIELRLAKLFEEEMHLVVPSADTDLFETGGMDSLSFVELLLYLERDFGVHVSLDAIDLGTFRSISGIAGFISDYRRALRAAAVRALRRG